MVTINCRIRDELTKDRYPARKHVAYCNGVYIVVMKMTNTSGDERQCRRSIAHEGAQISEANVGDLKIPKK
jgi:hypothetical protein